VRLTRNIDSLNLVDDVVRHVIEGVNPGDETDPAPFIGTRNQLECITALPNADSAKPNRRIEALLFVNAAHRLILRWRPYLHAVRMGARPRVTDTELLAGVSRLELAFWSPGSGWTGNWGSPDLPVLVRVRLQFDARGGHRWPDIVVARRLDRP
jgi:hypothetical protein